MLYSIKYCVQAGIGWYRLDLPSVGPRGTLNVVSGQAWTPTQVSGPINTDSPARSGPRFGLWNAIPRRVIRCAGPDSGPGRQQQPQPGNAQINEGRALYLMPAGGQGREKKTRSTRSSTFETENPLSLDISDEIDDGARSPGRGSWSPRSEGSPQTPGGAWSTPRGASDDDRNLALQDFETTKLNQQRKRKKLSYCVVVLVVGSLMLLYILAWLFTLWMYHLTPNPTFAVLVVRGAATLTPDA
jgi:hypothetical protein